MKAKKSVAYMSEELQKMRGIREMVTIVDMAFEIWTYWTTKSGGFKLYQTIVKTSGFKPYQTKWLSK